MAEASKAGRHGLIRAGIAGTWDTAEYPWKFCGGFGGRRGALLTKGGLCLKSRANSSAGWKRTAAILPDVSHTDGAIREVDPRPAGFRGSQSSG